MTQEFIPYEEALALKELGFDEPCILMYRGLNTQPVCQINYEFKTEKNSDYNDKTNWWLSVPLYQQAFRWFREKYNIDSWIQPFTIEKSNGVLYLPDETYSYFIFKNGVYVDDNIDFLEPKEAELECLKKLIEIVKTKNKL
jgi:hypothetical protein